MAAAQDPSQWLGLLRWSLAYQDGTKPSEELPKEMDAERKKFLEDAMKENVVNEADLMVECVDKLHALRQEEAEAEGAEDAEEQARYLFERIQDMVEHIDQAYNLHQVGKLGDVIQMLRDPNPVYRAGAAAVIATCSQNNKKVQTECLAQGALAYVTHMLVHDADQNVRTKALWALSCIVRNYSPGEGQFVMGDGVYVTCRGVRDADVRVRTKSLYLLSYLLNRDETLRTDACVAVYGIKVQEAGLAADLVAMIGAPASGLDLLEGVLEVIGKLVVMPQNCTGLLEAGLMARLESRLAELGALPGEEKEDGQGEVEKLAAIMEHLAAVAAAK